MYNMIPGCTEYKNNSKQQCKQCSQSYYLHFGQCLTSCEKNYFYLQNKCVPCDNSCLTCFGSSSIDCLTCHEDQYLFLDNSCTDCNSKGQIISNKSCQCVNNFIVQNSACVEKQEEKSSGSFDKETIQKLNKSTEVSLQVSKAVSTFLSGVQNIFSQSSFGVVMNGLTCLKLSYLSLINSDLPEQITSPLKAVIGKIKFLKNILNKLKNLIDQCPPNQFSSLNAFALMNSSNDDSQYQNSSYLNFNLSFNILKTSGQAIILFLICLFLFLVFFALTEKTKNKKVRSYSLKAFCKVFSSFIIQYFQLVIVMLVIGVNQQIKSFGYHFEGINLGIQILLLLVTIPLIILIFYQQYKFLNKQKPVKDMANFNQVVQEKIQNETIFESKIRRNFMLIYQIFESFLIPICFIQLSQSWIASCVIGIIIQLCQLSLTIYLKPFQSKITNFYFTIDSTLWLTLYAQFLIISIYSQKEDQSAYSSKIDSFSYSFLINYQMIMLELTLFLIVTLSYQAYQYIKNRRKKPIEKKENQVQHSQIELISKYYSSNNQFEVPDQINPSEEINIQDQSKMFNIYEKMFKKKQQPIEKTTNENNF